MISRVLLMPRVTGEGERIARVVPGDGQSPGLLLEIEGPEGARRTVWLTPTRLQTPVQLLSTRAETEASGEGLYVNEETVESIWEPTDPARVPEARQPRRLTRARAEDAASTAPLLARYARALEDASEERLRELEREMESRGSRWDMEAADVPVRAPRAVIAVPGARPLPRAVWAALAAPTRAALDAFRFEDLQRMAPAGAPRSRARLIDAIIAQRGLRVPLGALEPVE